MSLVSNNGQQIGGCNDPPSHLLRFNDFFICRASPQILKVIYDMVGLTV